MQLKSSSWADGSGSDPLDMAIESDQTALEGMKEYFKLSHYRISSDAIHSHSGLPIK